MDWTLEVVVVPVADVDRAKSFYADKVGFHVDHDTTVSDELRIVQLTPPRFGLFDRRWKRNGGHDARLTEGPLQLVVSDKRAAHAQLIERGVDVSEVQVYDSGGFRPSRERDVLDNVGFVYFSDPDGNGWAVQQISARG